jgi:hypothetical protein
VLFVLASQERHVGAFQGRIVTIGSEWQEHITAAEHES